MTIHAVDNEGNYISSYSDGAVPPDDAIIVPHGPAHGLDKWNFDLKDWDPRLIPAEETRKDKIKAALSDDDLVDLLLDVAQAINQVAPTAIRQSLKDKIRDALD